jgi:hypothetical protein
MRHLLPPPLIAMLIVGFGGLVEWAEYPGSVPTAHMFYAWGIIYAIFAGAGARAE